ncbi:MAG: hypothetical protein AAGE98_09850 [Actinomycetota bacterium]
MLLQHHALRYFLVVRILERGGVATVAELVDDLAAEGFGVHGRPSRTVSDAFRGERRRGRIVRLDRGRYGIGRLPKATKHRMVHRVAELRSRIAHGSA